MSVSRSVRPGDRVMHRVRGEGLVLGLSPGAKAKVRLDGDPGLPWTLSLGELRVIEPPPAPKPDVPKPVRKQPAGPSLTAWTWKQVPTVEPAANSLDRAELRQTIEAMRLGVVPAEYARDYTVGREEALQDVEDLLEVKGGLRVLWGDYGAGKTHMLDLAERVALERGYLTSRVVLDPHEVPPSHPRRLYSALVERLRYPDDQGHGLEPLLHRLADSKEHRSHLGHNFSRFLSPFLHAEQHGDAELSEWMRDYVDGCNMDSTWGNSRLMRSGWAGPRVLTMSDYRTYGRMYMHLLGTVAAWAEDAGYKGLFLLFDEVEFVDSLTPAQQGFAMEVLKHYAAVTLPREELRFDPDGLYKGGHKVHQELRLFFRSDQPLTVMFGLTPLPDIKESFDSILEPDLHDVQLPPLTEQDMGALADAVLRIYMRAYPDSSWTMEDLKKVQEGVEGAAADFGHSPRVLVRSIVGQLDALRWQARGWSPPTGF